MIINIYTFIGLLAYTPEKANWIMYKSQWLEERV